jgi:hypothetical protein
MMAVAEPVVHVSEDEVDELRTTLEEFPQDGAATEAEHETEEFLAQRRQTYAQVRDALRHFAHDERWRDHPLTVDLFTALIDLETAIEADETGADAHWSVRDARGALMDVLTLILHEVDHSELDDAAIAAHRLAGWLADVPDEEVGELVGVEGRTVRAWRQRQPRDVRADNDRVVLVAQLVYELRRSRVPAGVMRWFVRPRPQLGDRAPKELLAEPGENADVLRDLARGGRGQLAT